MLASRCGEILSQGFGIRSTLIARIINEILGIISTLRWHSIGRPNRVWTLECFLVLKCTHITANISLLPSLLSFLFSLLLAHCLALRLWSYDHTALYKCVYYYYYYNVVHWHPEYIQQIKFHKRRGIFPRKDLLCNTDNWDFWQTGDWEKWNAKTQKKIMSTYGELASVCIKAHMDCVFKVWRWRNN